MFEPFHCKKVTLLKGWRYHQYLRSDNRDEKFLEPATTILGGKIRNEWIDQFNRKRIVRKRLIKDIRANLLLKWIRENFPERSDHFASSTSVRGSQFAPGARLGDAA